MNRKILVTGASGFIGGCTVLRLADIGYEVIGLDKTEPSAAIKSACIGFYVCDFNEIPAMNIMRTQDIGTIIHCAAFVQVGESVRYPQRYYQNNYISSKELLDYLIAVQLTKAVRVIFSSTAAVYGEPIMIPCSEEDPPLPINPYGESKLMLEMTAAAYQRAHELDYVAFRYFNAAGADSQARHGQASGASHIIARVLESIKNNTTFVLNGIDYPTVDGTCVRDYIHVEDIVESHVMAMNRDIPSGIYNLGSNIGTSNREIIDAVTKITGQSPNVEIGPARDGDSSALTASADKWNKVSGWTPTRSLNDIISHAWGWYQK